MLNDKIRKKLDSLTQIPAIPAVVSEVLNSVDNLNVSASAIAAIIEQDQALTARVLSVANSPFYGFSRKISTIDLAIVVLGLNSIKEIVLSLIIQRFFDRIRKDIFDVNEFWHYSVFCGACARILAKKLGYRITGEAFVAGLTHDIGVLIILQYFTKEFHEIRKIQAENKISLVEAEQIILGNTHSDIGAWFAEKWNLPDKLCKAIQNHHSTYLEIKQKESESPVPQSYNSYINQKVSNDFNLDIEQPLTLIVAMTEWFAADMGYNAWIKEEKPSTLYLASEILDELREHEMLNSESAWEMLKQEILTEYNNASVFTVND